MFAPDSGAGGSRVTHVAGQATYQAALALQQQLCEVAATGLGCPPSAVTLDNGACVVHSAPTQRLTFAEVAAAAAAGRRPLRVQKLYRLGEYNLPNIKDIPPLRTVLVQDEVGPAPFQGKAIGESSITPIAAALANAVYDAVGVRLHDLPITAEKVYHALQTREGRTL